MKKIAFQITSFDKERLRRLLASVEAEHGAAVDAEDLSREIERGTEVAPTEVGADVVTMNSTVRVTDLESGTAHVYTIVFPSDADYEKGRVSILSPAGTALLGARIGDEVTWSASETLRRVRIEELLYQPEAAGDFHL